MSITRTLTALDCRRLRNRTTDKEALRQQQQETENNGNSHFHN